MAVNSKNKHSVWMLLLITLIGLILGSYTSLIIDSILQLISGENAGLNPISFFTTTLLPIKFGYPDPINLDLGVLKFNIGVQLDINIISFLGIWLSHKFFKSYK